MARTIAEQLGNIETKDDLSPIYLTGNMEVLEAFERHGVDRLHDIMDVGYQARTKLVSDMKKNLSKETLDSEIFVAETA